MQSSKIAYLIQAHEDPENLLRMINALDDNNDFFVHIDKKANIDPFCQLLKAKNNVFLMEDQNRIDVIGEDFLKLKLH